MFRAELEMAFELRFYPQSRHALERVVNYPLQGDLL